MYTYLSNIMQLQFIYMLLFVYRKKKQLDTLWRNKCNISFIPVIQNNSPLHMNGNNPFQPQIIIDTCGHWHNNKSIIREQEKGNPPQYASRLTTLQLHTCTYWTRAEGHNMHIWQRSRSELPLDRVSAVHVNIHDDLVLSGISNVLWSLSVKAISGLRLFEHAQLNVFKHDVPLP